MINENVNCLVLGCTHYAYLIPQIRKIVGNQMQIIDSSEAVARQTKAVLQANKILNNDVRIGQHQFYINKNKIALEKTLSNYADKIKITEKSF
jgi:glutamate racemase